MPNDPLDAFNAGISGIQVVAIPTADSVERDMRNRWSRLFNALDTMNARAQNQSPALGITREAYFTSAEKNFFQFSSQPVVGSKHGKSLTFYLYSDCAMVQCRATGTPFGNDEGRYGAAELDTLISKVGECFAASLREMAP